MKTKVEEIQKLKSSGVTTLNAPESTSNDGATIIVVGVSRSGTSMVAACLKELGIFMGGPKLGAAVHEDLEIANVLESGTRAKLRELIEERNKSHKIWGFKRPMIFNSISENLDLFRNPRFVIPFRDPVAIAMRNQISMHMSFLKALRLAGDQTADLIEFVEKLKYPVMLVSYEKALLDPLKITSEIARFSGSKASEKMIQSASGAVENGPQLYLDSSRLKFEGRVDRVADGYALGWARQIGQKKPCSIVVRSNGRVIGRGKADIYRADLEKAGKEGGNCGFKIELDDRSAKISDITAAIEGTTFQLRTAVSGQ